MAEQTQVTVEKVETITLKYSKKPGTFKMTEITGGDKKFKGFTNSLGTLPEVGDVVDITFQPVKNGKFTNNNIVSLSHAVATPAVKTVSESKTVKSSPVVVSTTKQTSAVSQTTSKDISMEVSGLLQALLGTGHYHIVKPNEKYSNNDVFLSEKLLETHLRMALTLKRKVAGDLEQNGSV